MGKTVMISVASAGLLSATILFSLLDISARAESAKPVYGPKQEPKEAACHGLQQSCNAACNAMGLSAALDGTMDQCNAKCDNATVTCEGSGAQTAPPRKTGPGQAKNPPNTVSVPKSHPKKPGPGKVANPPSTMAKPD